MDGCRSVDYVHLLFDRHEVIFANGVACESFYPGPATLATLDAAALVSLYAVLPTLMANGARAAYGPPALPYARMRELPGHISGLRARLGTEGARHLMAG